MIYKNTKTGIVFESSCEMSGPNWEVLKEDHKEEKAEIEQVPEKKTKRKK